MSIAKRNSQAAKAWADKRREARARATTAKALCSTEAHGAPPSSFPISSEIHREERLVPAGEQPLPVRYAASTSHAANAAYMAEFRRNIADMYSALGDNEGRGAQAGPPFPGGGCGATAAAATLRDSGAPCVDFVHARDHPSEHFAALGSRNVGHIRELRASLGGVRGSFRRVASARRGACSRGSKKLLLSTEFTRDKASNSTTAEGWRTGPEDPAGKLVDLSERNLLCASVFGDEAVFGCADHALYCVDIARGLKTRQLYGTRSRPDAGHKDWVTAVCHLPGGHVVSGGMDGKLCWWPKSKGAGPLGEVQAHAGSVSAVKADADATVVTSGYGGAVRLWDCRGRGGAAADSDGHRLSGPLRMIGELADLELAAPCMDFAWRGTVMFTGHRDGRVGQFDLETGAVTMHGDGSRYDGGSGHPTKGNAHRGHVTTVLAPDRTDGGMCAACFVTGGQDGFVRVWDPRTSERRGSRDATTSGRGGAVMEVPAHRSRRGVGAVGGIRTLGSLDRRLLSFGADKRVCVLEVRGGRGGSTGGGHHVAATSGDSPRKTSCLTVSHVFEEHQDFIYSMDLIFSPRGSREGAFLVTGGGDGMLLVHDLDTMTLLYGLGCSSEGAVRCAVACTERLIVAGDDGNAMLYNFRVSRTSGLR